MAWQARANAQPAGGQHLIGILGNEFTPLWERLFSQLRDLGYVEGENLTIVARWSGGIPDKAGKQPGDALAVL